MWATLSQGQSSIRHNTSKVNPVYQDLPQINVGSSCENGHFGGCAFSNVQNETTSSLPRQPGHTDVHTDPGLVGAGSWASPGVAAPSLQAAPRIRTLNSRTPPAPSFTIHCALTSALLWHILQATAKTQASWPEMPRSGSKSGVNSGLQPSTATPHTHEVRFKTLRHLHPPKSRRGSVHPEWQ